MAILYEDRSILALDKPAGWILGPDDWQHTARNLSLILQVDIQEGEWWAKSRNLKFLRYIHRLDGPTSGVMLWAKHPGVLEPFSRLFATRAIRKTYLAVVEGTPEAKEWTRRDKLGPDPRVRGRHQVDPRDGREAETHFKLLAVSGKQSLILCEPFSGRTHQIRLHLLASGFPVVGDELYGRRDELGLGLRAVRLEYRDPFRHQPIVITAPVNDFCWRHGFRPPAELRQPSDWVPPLKASGLSLDEEEELEAQEDEDFPEEIVGKLPKAERERPAPRPAPARPEATRPRRPAGPAPHRRPAR